MGWVFLDDADEAKDGVTDGKYYAAVVIPEDFSENLLSITTGKFKQAKLQYYVNEKKNAVAPKITDKGIEAIRDNVDSEYVSAITEALAVIILIMQVAGSGGTFPIELLPEPFKFIAPLGYNNCRGAVVSSKKIPRIGNDVNLSFLSKIG